MAICPYPDAKEGRAGALPGFRLVRALPDALAHGFAALDVDDVRAVDDAVDGRVGDGSLAELGMPSHGRELRADQQRPRPQAPLDYLEQLAGLSAADLLQEPVVEYQQVAFEGPYRAGRRKPERPIG